MTFANRSIRQVFPVTLAMALVGTAARTQADEVVKIAACPFVISAPGHYLLVTDLVCPIGNAISVANTSDVHLNLGGHTIDGAGTASRGVLVFRSEEVNIQNGTIIRFQGVDPGNPGGASGLEFNQSSRVFATNLDLNANTNGMTLFRATNNLVINCNASGNTRIGIQMQDAISNEIRGNRINNNGLIGIDVRGPEGVPTSQQNALVANELVGNASFGIRLRNSLNNTVRNNRVHETVLAGGAGIMLDLSSSNTVRNNRTTENSRGIWVRLASLNNTIETNTSVQNVIFDLEDDNPLCDANVWRNNNFNTANQPCIQ